MHESDHLSRCDPHQNAKPEFGSVGQPGVIERVHDQDQTFNQDSCHTQHRNIERQGDKLHLEKGSDIPQ